MSTVHFYYSIGSRYSYLASTQIASLEKDSACSVEWRPLNSVRLIERRGASPFKDNPVSGQYDWPYRERDARRWAALYDVPFVEPRGRLDLDANLLALAAVVAKRLDRVEAYSRALFSAVFAEPAVARVDRAECIRRAEACSISPSAFADALDDPVTAQELSAATETAHKAGAFGVPTFVVGNELFWGNDRLVLLRKYLADSEANRGRR